MPGPCRCLNERRIRGPAEIVEGGIGNAAHLPQPRWNYLEDILLPWQETRDHSLLLQREAGIRRLFIEDQST